MKVLILPSWKKATCEELISGNLQSYELYFAKFTDIAFKISKGEIQITFEGHDLKNFDFVWLSSMWTTRDVAYGVSLYLTYHKVRHTKVEFASSKITDQISLALDNINTPNTWYKPGLKKKDSFEEIESVCKYPMILKDKIGAQGKNVHLVADRRALKKKYRQSSESKRYMIQGFIPNDYEWGLIVANGKIVSVEKKFAARGEHRNNVHMGGTEEFLEINQTPISIQEIAIKTAKCLGLNWCRVDILENKMTNELYVLETNRFPGLTIGSSELNTAREFLKNSISEF